MKNTLRAFAVCAALTLLSPSTMAAPFVANATMVAQLNALIPSTSPMANSGLTLFEQGYLYDVDPRLIVAIAAAQSNFGLAPQSGCANPATTNDPFYFLGCTGGGVFATIGDAIAAVAQDLKFNYPIFNGPANTKDLIPLVANRWCAPAFACVLTAGQWAAVVEKTYTDPALADAGTAAAPTDLTYPGATIAFEQFTSAPSLFSGLPLPPLPPVAVTVGTAPSVTATFTGGAVLNAASNLPVDQSVVYGTADFCNGCTQSIDIFFSAPVSTVSFFLINGNTVTATYDTTDFIGVVAPLTLAPNTASGVGSVTLNDSNIVHVNITAVAAAVPPACCVWDYFIDNLAFGY